MNITGKNLEFLSVALDYALQGIHNQIANCPDVFEYEEKLEDLEALESKVTALKERADTEIKNKAEARHLSPSAGDMKL